MERIDARPTHTHAGYHFRMGRAFPFGATFVPGGINFSVFSSHATACALVLFDKVLAINPQFPMALLFKGRLLYEEKKDYAGAIASWERFLQTVPQGEPADVVRGWIEEARREARQDTDDSLGRKTP